MADAVTLDDVVAARAFLRAYLEPTPLVRREGVSAALGLDVRLKCESLLPTGAFMPVGGGSGAAGAAIVAKAMRPDVQVIGVQAAGAPAAYLSWKERAPRETTRIETFADGLATRTPFALPQRILAELLDDFVLVTDDELYAAMRLLLVEGHLVAEGAGAAATAAALQLAPRLTGRKVVCWISGGNATAESLRRALDA